MTEKVLKKISDRQRKQIEEFRSRIKAAAQHGGKYGVWEDDVLRKAAYWYLKGLMDAGTITDRERQVLYCYATL